jgi:hypothetical protein
MEAFKSSLRERAFNMQQLPGGDARRYLEEPQLNRSFIKP